MAMKQIKDGCAPTGAFSMAKPATHRENITHQLQARFLDSELVESSALLAAQLYSDPEPLLQLFETQGLNNPDARKFVANLARGKALLRPGQHPRTFDDEYRNHKICLLVANQQGFLEYEGKDARKAFANVAAMLQQKGIDIGAKQVKNIWKARPRSASDRMAYEHGKSGTKGMP